MTAPLTAEALKATRQEAGKVVDLVCHDRGWGFRGDLIAVIAPLIAKRDAAEASLQRVTAERDEARAENDRLRAGLANGSGPCAYCNLSREDWSKCQSGFPGCGRADDAMLCPHFGAEMEANERADTATAEAARLRGEVEAKDRALKQIAEFPETYDDGRVSHGLGYAFHFVKEIARTALARAATEEGQADG